MRNRIINPFLRDKADPNMLNGGGTALSEQEFQSRTLEAVGKVKTTVDEMVQKYDNLDRVTKSAFEELTKIKNDSKSNMDEVLRSIQKVQLRLNDELRSANGSPIERIKRDPEKKLLFNALVRNAAGGWGMTPEMRTILGEDATPGSSLIRDGLADDIYDTLATYGIWNTFAVTRVGTKTTKFPVNTARPNAAFILTEGATITEDTANAGTSVDLTLEVIGAYLPVSKQLLADSEFDVTADVLAQMAEAIAYRIDWACTSADGGNDATDGVMTGIFGGGGTAANATSTRTTVEATKLNDWTNAMLAVDPVVLTRQARWWIHPKNLVRALNVVDSNGRPIFLTANEAPTMGGIGSILGYPVVPTFAAPDTNTASSKVAVFGDPAGLAVGIQNGYELEQSDHAGFSTYTRVFRGIARAGVKVRRSQAFGVLTLAAS